MKTKIFLTISMTLSICLLALVGCKDKVSRKTRLVLAAPASEQSRPILLSTIEQFETKHPNIEVQLLEIPGNYYQKLLVMIAGRTAPDIMWMGQSFAEFAVRGVFLNITEQIKNDPEINIKQYHPKVLSWYRLNGKQLGIPYGIDVEFIAYNKALFRKYHVPYPKDSWSIKEFLETARKLTADIDNDGRIDQYGYYGRINPSAFGAAIVSDDGKKVLCDSPEMINFIKFNLDMVYKWKICPPPDNPLLTSVDKFSIFHQGKVAMMRFCTFDLPFLRDQCADIDWDITLIPKAKRRAYWASSNAYLISADTKHPNEAWLLFKEFISRKFQLALSSETLPANIEVAKYFVERNTRKPRNIKCLLDTLDYLYPYPRVPNLQEIMHAYWLDLSKTFTFYNKPSMWVTPEQAMKRAAERIRKIIKRNQRRYQ